MVALSAWAVGGWDMVGLFVSRAPRQLLGLQGCHQRARPRTLPRHSSFRRIHVLPDGLK